MTIEPYSDGRPGRGGVEWSTAAGAALLVLPGLLFWLARDYSPDAAGHWEELSVKGGACVAPAAVGLITAVFALIGRCFRRGWPLLVLGALLSAGLAAQGWWVGRGTAWLARLGVDPAPAIEGDVRAWHASSFSDGNAYLFRFVTAPAEVDALVARLGLTEAAAPMQMTAEERAGLSDLADLFAGDRALRKDFRDAYVRPVGVRAWAGREYVVVTDGGRREVWLYVDRWTRR